MNKLSKIVGNNKNWIATT